MRKLLAERLLFVSPRSIKNTFYHKSSLQKLYYRILKMNYRSSVFATVPSSSSSLSVLLVPPADFFRPILDR
jgi:hypothetical protein